MANTDDPLSSFETLPPLARELGFERGTRCWFRDLPADVRTALAPDKAGLEELEAPSDGIEASLIFVDARQQLEKELSALCKLLTPSGFVWVAYAGELDEPAVLDAADPCDLVPAGTVTIAGRRAMKLAIHPRRL